MSLPPSRSTPPPTAGESDTPPNDCSDPPAVRDLADGIGLLLRAAKKAVDGIDRQTLQDLGQKAAERINRSELERWAEKGTQQLVGWLGRITDQLDEYVKAPPRRPGGPRDAAPSAPPAPGVDPLTKEPGETGETPRKL